VEDSRDEIHRIGHRKFVGGPGKYWNEIAELQFRALVEQGLSPSDYFIDVACGALRGGKKFIRYLEPAHYLGIDKHIELVIYGVAEELSIGRYREKRPQFVISEFFEFEKFDQRPTFGIAQSLFTHLTSSDSELCLRKLKQIAAPGCRFFVTFFETPDPAANPETSHSHGRFVYTRAQMEAFGGQTGWTPRYIGEWNHPRGQKMIEYIAA
jgi:hypothetical protein